MLEPANTLTMCDVLWAHSERETDNAEYQQFVPGWKQTHDMRR